MRTKILLFLIIVITLSLSTFINSQNSQRLSHLGYTYAERDTTDYHSYEIIWYKEDLADGAITLPSETKYYVIRKATPFSSNLGVDLNSRYSEYLMEINGMHLTKHYVAWDIVSTNENCANDYKRVSFKAKFFNRSWDALKFYESLSGAKVRFSPSRVENYDSLTSYKKLAKFDTNTWTVCPVV